MSKHDEAVENMHKRIHENYLSALDFGEKAERTLKLVGPIVEEWAWDGTGDVLETDQLMLQLLGNISMTAVDIDYHAQGDKGIEDVRPILRAIARTRMFQPATFIGDGIPTWEFKPKNSDDLVRVRVYAFISESNRCRYVETGEVQIIKKRKLVCDGEEVTA